MIPATPRTSDSSESLTPHHGYAPGAGEAGSKGWRVSLWEVLPVRRVSVSV